MDLACCRKVPKNTNALHSAHFQYLRYYFILSVAVNSCSFCYLQGREAGTADQPQADTAEQSLLESEEHEAGLLAGLGRLRERGLLLDTALWAEGEKFQARL